MGFPSLLSSKAPERIIKCGHMHLQRRKPLSWQATALIHRSAHSSLHRSVNPRAHRQRRRVLHCSQWQPGTGCYFTFWRRLCVRVLRGLPAAMTLEHKDACGCVVDRSLFEFPEWAAAWRWAVAHHRGRCCLPRLRFRSWSEQPSFFVTIPTPWFVVPWKHHSGEKDNRFWRFKL